MAERPNKSKKLLEPFGDPVKIFTEIDIFPPFDLLFYANPFWYIMTCDGIQLFLIFCTKSMSGPTRNWYTGLMGNFLVFPVVFRQ